MADTSKEKSLYIQTADLILERVVSGIYSIGTVIPREVDLCKELKVSRNTIRSALSLLENEGIVQRKKRAGTTIISNRRTSTFGFDISSIEGIRLYIRNTTLIVIERANKSIPTELKQIVGIAPDMPWVFVSAIRKVPVSNNPIASIEIFVNPKFGKTAKRFGLSKSLLYENIERDHGIIVDRMDVILRPMTVGEVWAKPLCCSPYLPAINMIEIVHATNGTIVELASVIIPQNRLEFVFSIHVDR